MKAINASLKVSFLVTAALVLSNCGKKNFSSNEALSSQNPVNDSGTVTPPPGDNNPPPNTNPPPNNDPSLFSGDRCYTMFTYALSANNPNKVTTIPYDQASCLNFGAQATSAYTGGYTSTGLSYTTYHLTQAQIQAILVSMFGRTTVSQAMVDAQAYAFLNAVRTTAASSVVLDHAGNSWYEDIF